MNNIDRTRSQKCYAVYEQTQNPNDKVDADLVFGLETARSEAAAVNGSERTVACFDRIINEITDTVTNTQYKVVVTLTVAGETMYSTSTTEDLGLHVDAATTCSWAAEMLRSAADFIEGAPECDCVDCEGRWCPDCGEPLEGHDQDHEIEA